MNPVHGADQGPPHVAAQAQYLPQRGHYNMYPGAAIYNPLAAYQQPMFGAAMGHMGHMGYMGQHMGQGAYPLMPNGSHVMQARHAGPCPRLDPDMPANQMSNSTGGTGCEPGYNYFFPAEHTKVHVLKCDTKPWQLPMGAEIPFHAAHVPVSTTCADILKGYGATNDTPKLNRCFEVVQGGNGRWYRGLSFGGENKEMMKTKIEALGWDKTRTGRPGERPVVCLWITKEG